MLRYGLVLFRTCSLRLVGVERVVRRKSLMQAPFRAAGRRTLLGEAAQWSILGDACPAEDVIRYRGHNAHVVSSPST